jgi:arginase family enzyme
VKTTAVFFPFDLFGGAGTGAGVELLADAFKELLDDNKRERVPTRARAYAGKVRVQEIAFDQLSAYTSWRENARAAVASAWTKNDFLLWIAGNHLGVLPVYDELAAAKNTVVIQFDAHLDIYNLSDCKADLSHGNFLLHCAGTLPPLVNIGHRELLLRPGYIDKYYQKTFAAAELAVNAEPAFAFIRDVCAKAERVIIDIDCDIFDAAYFPALAQPVPLGLSPAMLVRFVDAIWSDKVIGVALSEFDPARDECDRSLETLMWLIEYVLLKKYEA